MLYIRTFLSHYLMCSLCVRREAAAAAAATTAAKKKKKPMRIPKKKASSSPSSQDAVAAVADRYSCDLVFSLFEDHLV